MSDEKIDCNLARMQEVEMFLRGALPFLTWTRREVPPAGNQAFAYEAVGPEGLRVLAVQFETGQGPGWDGTAIHGATILRLRPELAEFVVRVAKTWLENRPS